MKEKIQSLYEMRRENSGQKEAETDRNESRLKQIMLQVGRSYNSSGCACSFTPKPTTLHITSGICQNTNSPISQYIKMLLILQSSDQALSLLYHLLQSSQLEQNNLSPGFCQHLSPPWSLLRLTSFWPCFDFVCIYLHSEMAIFLNFI